MLKSKIFDLLKQITNANRNYRLFKKNTFVMNLKNVCRQ